MEYKKKIETFFKEKSGVIDKVIEAGLYLFIFFLFLTKGEGIRNILLYSNFALWLATLRQRKNLHILKEPLALFFWGFMISTFLSAVFSIDIRYSFKELKIDFLQSLLFFPVLATVLSDNKRLKRFVWLALFLLIFLVANGFYSYLVYNMPFMLSETPLRHAFHNRFARDLNMFLAFSFALLLMTKGKAARIFITLMVFTGIFGLILTVSRGGIIAFLAICFVWLASSWRKRYLHLKPVLISVMLAVVLLGVIAYVFVPDIKKRISLVSQTEDQIITLNKRTTIWMPVLYASMKRPLFGWGYGEKIFRKDTPFEDTPYKTSPYKSDIQLRDPHNTFLSELLNQGIVGLGLYLALLITAARGFWLGTHSTNETKNYILLACTSILVGTYFVHSMVEVVKFRYLTLILGVGLAAKHVNSEDSHR
jgi:O-antigen ligase